MKLFKEKETFTENIAFMGMSAGVVAALAVFSSFFPLSTFFIILFIPLLAALTAYYCQNKYLMLYIVGAISVSLIVTAYDISVTLFDVAPSILTGTAFGYLLKKRIPYTMTILIASLLKVGLNYLMLLLLKSIYGIDMIETFLTLLNLQDKEKVSFIIPSFIFGYSLIQETISFFVITLNTPDLKENAEPHLYSLIISSISILIVSLAFILSFLSPLTGYFLGSIGIYLSLAGGKALLRKHPIWFYIMLAILMAGSFYLSVFFYSSLSKDNSMLLFLTFFASLSLCEVISSLLFKNEKGGEE